MLTDRVTEQCASVVDFNKLPGRLTTPDVYIHRYIHKQSVNTGCGQSKFLNMPAQITGDRQKYLPLS